MASGLEKVSHAVTEYQISIAHWRDAMHHKNFNCTFNVLLSNIVQYTLYIMEVRNVKQIYEHTVGIPHPTYVSPCTVCQFLSLHQQSILMVCTDIIQIKLMYWVLQIILTRSTHRVYHSNFHQNPPFGGTLNASLNSKYINSECTSIDTPEHTQKITVISGLPQSSGRLVTDCIQQLDRYTMIRPHAGADSPLGTCKGRSTPTAAGKPQPERHFMCRRRRLILCSIISF